MSRAARLVTRYATELVIQHDAKIAGLHDLLRRMISEIEDNSDATGSRAASRGFADPWARGWYCTGCGPMGSTKDKRPPDRTVRDGRYVFTCPVHGEIPVRWPNGSGAYPENYREGNVPLDADDPPATPDRAAKTMGLLPADADGHIARGLVAWVAHEFGVVGEPEQYLRGAGLVRELVEEADADE